MAGFYYAFLSSSFLLPFLFFALFPFVFSSPFIVLKLSFCLFLSFFRGLIHRPWFLFCPSFIFFSSILFSCSSFFSFSSPLISGSFETCKIVLSFYFPSQSDVQPPHLFNYFVVFFVQFRHISLTSITASTSLSISAF